MCASPRFLFLDRRRNHTVPMITASPTTPTPTPIPTLAPVDRPESFGSSVLFGGEGEEPEVEEEKKEVEDDNDVDEVVLCANT